MGSLGSLWDHIKQQKYERGKAIDSVKEIGDSKSNGTSVTFLPDKSIFIDTNYVYDILAARMRELSFLNKGIRLVVVDKTIKKEKSYEFKYDGGLIEFILSEQSQNYDLDKTEFRQIISGFIIILSWAELFSLATKHPELSR